MADEPEITNQENRYCEAIDQVIEASHEYFLYIAEMKLAMASLGMAVASGTRLQATREILDMADTLFQNITDPDSVLPDNQRKQLNHADEVWLDMKDKMSKGDQRASNLLSAHAFMEMAIVHLISCKKDIRFKNSISDYLVNYLGKLSVFIYREAIGHVML
jgi:hypothetical protein